MQSLPRIQQSPTAPAFLEDPYAFYERARTLGDFVYWDDYEMVMAVSHEAVGAVLSSPATGREPPHASRKARPEHLSIYHSIDDHSLLRLEGSEHARLKSLAREAFNDQAIFSMAPTISQICDTLIDAFPKNASFDLQSAFADKVTGIALMRLFGFPDDMQTDFARWASAIDGLFHARRNRATEDAAEKASIEYSEFMKSHLANLRKTGSSDGIVGRIVASNQTLAEEEILALVQVITQAGASASAYSIGTSILTLMESPDQKLSLTPEYIEMTVAECLRFEPPFHILFRYAQEDVTILDASFPRNAEIGCLLGSACRDDAVWPDGNLFDPFRAGRPNFVFGKGVHACLGSSLANLTMQIALPALFSRCPSLQLVNEPTYANDYMFRRLERLDVHL